MTYKVMFLLLRMEPKIADPILETTEELYIEAKPCDLWELGFEPDDPEDIEHSTYVIWKDNKGNMLTTNTRGKHSIPLTNIGAYLLAQQFSYYSWPGPAYQPISLQTVSDIRDKPWLKSVTDKGCLLNSGILAREASSEASGGECIYKFYPNPDAFDKKSYTMELGECTSVGSEGIRTVAELLEKLNVIDDRSKIALSPKMDNFNQTWEYGLLVSCVESGNLNVLPVPLTRYADKIQLVLERV